MGTCMRSYHEENLKTPTEGLNFKTFVEFTGHFLAQVRMSYRLSALEPLKHTLDAFLTWMIGVVSGVQDVTATLDMAHCRLPDFYMQDVFQCACNDTAYSIPRNRAEEDYTKGAFWCSGTLNMLGTDQNPIVVFNPYSYYELQSRLSGLDEYLKCLSQFGSDDASARQATGETCESIRPYVDKLEEQGVSSIAVLTRCKANYAALQWDEGTAVLFQSDEVFERLTKGKVRMAQILWMRETFLSFPNAYVTSELKDCILATAASGQPPDACLTDIFLKKQKKEDYFIYETAPSTRKESMMVDACEVHTGPAKELGNMSSFQQCLDNDLETQCNVPSFIWSGRSSGKTPVANFHSWKDLDTGDDAPKMQRALTEFKAIASKISSIILAVNNSFAADGITAELFSAEGDALHQVMDCIFMGPYARMDYYGSRGSSSASQQKATTLPVPSWSRRNSEDEEDTRTLPLPCTGSAMQGDFKVPFTCGSPARRALIKYFVRSFAIPASGDTGFCQSTAINATVQDANKQRLLNAIYQRLNTLYDNWRNYYNFFCEDPETGQKGMDQCNTDDAETWTPQVLRKWDHISSADVAKEIFESLGCFYQVAMRDTSVWTTHMNPAELQKFKWSNNSAHSFAAAQQSSLFHTHKPVVEYSEKTELNEPLQVSMKEMCAGLLSQVFFTIPLSQNANGQWVPSTLKSVDAFYSPYTASSTPNITALEDFMLKVTKEAFYMSPYYRHYGMRHLASNSTACPTYAATVEQQQEHPFAKQGYTVLPETLVSQMDASYFANFSIKHKGFMSHLLGSASTTTCFCGFPKVANSSSMCQLPDVIVRDISIFGDTLLPSTPDYAYLRYNIVRDQQGRFDLRTENHRVQRTLSKVWLADGRWSCPQLDELSDHWGFVKDTEQWIHHNSNSNGTEEALMLNATDFLQLGYGGLRVGTMKHVQEQVKQRLTPSHRIGTQNPSDGGPITGHTRCEADKEQMKPESLVDRFIDDLFPVAQGKSFFFSLPHI